MYASSMSWRWSDDRSNSGSTPIGDSTHSPVKQTAILTRRGTHGS
jgi:hypothetical protein